MALRVGQLYATVDMESDGFNRSANRLTQSFGRIKNAVTGLFLGGAIVGVGRQLLSLGSDAEETNGRFSVVFGDLNRQASQWADNFASATGRGRSEIRSYLASSQDLLVGFGFTREAGADLSQQIVALGVDIASFQNADEAETIMRIESAIRGEAGSAATLGVVLNDVARERARMNLGIENTLRNLTAEERALINFQVLLEGTTDSQGDATRTAGSFANQVRRLGNSLTTIAEVIGGLLIPVFGTVVNSINSFLAPAIDSINMGLTENDENVVAYVESLNLGERAISGLAGAFQSLPDPIQESISMFAEFSSDVAEEGAFLGMNFINGFLQNFEGIQEEIMRFFDLRIEFGGDIFQGLVDAFNYVMPYLITFSNLFGRVLGTLFESGLSIFNSISEIIVGAFESVVNFIDENSELFVPIQEAIDDIFPLISEFGESVIEFAMEIASVVEENIPIIMGIIDQIFKFLQPIFAVALRAIQAIIRILGIVIRIVIRVVQTATRILRPAFRLLLAAISFFIEYFGNILKRPVRIITEFIDIAIGFVTDFFENLEDIFDAGLMVVDEVIMFFINIFEGNFDEAFMNIINIVDGLLVILGETIDTALDVLGGIIKIALVTVKNILVAPFESAFNTIAGIVKGIQKFFGVINEETEGNEVYGNQDQVQNRPITTYTDNTGRTRVIRNNSSPAFGGPADFGLPEVMREIRNGSVPAFASGGIVDYRQLAIVGDAGREGIVPLQGSASQMFAREFINVLQSQGLQGSGGNMQINIYSNQNPREIAQQVSREIRRETERRRRGRA